MERLHESLEVAHLVGEGALRATEVRTRGTAGNRDGIGTRVRMVAGGRQQIREIRAGSSYLSCSGKQASFGLAQSESVDSLELVWPSGRVEQFTAVEADRVVVVEEGKGMAGARQ